jgi:hypothetical protein
MPETTVDASAQKLPVCRHIRVESARHVLLAMQKVEGSNAFSRFQKTCICRSFSGGIGLCVDFAPDRLDVPTGSAGRQDSPWSGAGL